MNLFTKWMEAFILEERKEKEKKDSATKLWLRYDAICHHEVHVTP